MIMLGDNKTEDKQLSENEALLAFWGDLIPKTEKVEVTPRRKEGQPLSENEALLGFWGL